MIQEPLFTTVRLETFVSQDHPVRALRVFIDEALKELNGLFDAIYAGGSRNSIPPERLLCEQLPYNLLFRWFVGLPIEEAAWGHSTFSKKRDRLLDHEVIPRLFAEVVDAARRRNLRRNISVWMARSSSSIPPHDRLHKLSYTPLPTPYN